MSDMLTTYEHQTGPLEQETHHFCNLQRSDDPVSVSFVAVASTLENVGDETFWREGSDKDCRQKWTSRVLVKSACHHVCHHQNK